MACQVLLHHLEEQLIGIAREVCPTLAYGNPSLSFADRLHNAQIAGEVWLSCAPRRGGWGPVTC